MPTKEYKKGIEQIPIREIITTLPITVFIVRLEDDEIVEQLELDYSKPDDKKHLARISAWCFLNKHGVEMYKTTDIDQPEVK